MEDEPDHAHPKTVLDRPAPVLVVYLHRADWVMPSAVASLVKPWVVFFHANGGE